MGLKQNNYEQLALNVGHNFTLEDYANFIHPEDAYITVATKSNDKWVENSYRTDEWPVNVKIDSMTDSYNSVNTFYIPRRGNDNVRHLNAFYVDLDIYNVGLSKNQAIEQIEFLINTDRIPQPTMIIDSGRGLYAIWKINSVPGKFKNVQRLYSHIQKYLIETMTEIGSDPQASDMARVLRTPGTYNTKSNSVVKVMRSEGIVYAMRYLQEFMNDNIGYDQESINKRNKERKERQRRNKQKGLYKKGKLSCLFNYYTLAIARENDIRKVCELRDYDVVGYRNMIVHIYAYQVLLIEKNVHVARDKTKELNNKFTIPLEIESVNEVINTVYKAYQDHLRDKSKGYNYKNQTIIKKMNITFEEQKEMKTLISMEEKRQRDYANRREKRRDKKGLTAKQQEIRDRQLKVSVLYKKGLNQSQIAKELGVHKSTISRILDKK